MKGKKSELVAKVDIHEINGQSTTRPFPELVIKFDDKLSDYIIISASGTDVFVLYKDFLHALEELKK